MKNKIIIGLFILCSIVAVFFISHVTVNYNLENYLPKDSEIKEGIDVYFSEFGDTSVAYIAFNEDNIKEATSVKNSIKDISGVKEVIYLDNYFNEVAYSILRDQLTTAQLAVLDPLFTSLLDSGYSYPEIFKSAITYFPDEYKTEYEAVFNRHSSEDESMFQIVFNTKSSDKETETAIEEIKQFMESEGYETYYTGNAVSTIFTKNTIEKEVLIITLICIPLVLIVLGVLSKSYFDIIIFGIVVGVSIVINLGTNIFLPDISFITKSMAIVLQLAISLDYVIFYINSYHNAKDNGEDTDAAIKLANKKTRKPILASALTTMVSFLALTFMQFTIGFDIGIVFAKAIFISLIATLILLPVLIKMFFRIIDKTRKKAKMEYRYGFISKLHKIRYVFLVLLIVILGFSVYFQSKSEYTYGSSSFAGGQGTEYTKDLEHINNEFGYNNQVIILLPRNDLDEAMLYNELSQLSYVENINAGIYYKQFITDPMVLGYITENLYSNNYALLQFNLLSDVEGEEAFGYYEELSNIAESLEKENIYIIGDTSTAYHIKDTVSFDYKLVNVIALIAIMVIIFITFRNLFMPILLPLVIETSVFLTMAILSFMMKDVSFLASLIVSAILLGVTIDYGILLGKSYLTSRQKYTKEESIKKGVMETLPSIIISASLFSIAGLTVCFASSIKTISQIGLILGMGSIISLIFIVIVLPQMLSIFDKWICKGNVDKNS